MAAQTPLNLSAKKFEPIQEAECNATELFNKGDYLLSAKEAKILLGLLKPIAESGVVSLEKAKHLNETLQLDSDQKAKLHSAKICEKLTDEYTLYDEQVSTGICPLKDCAEGEICTGI